MAPQPRECRLASTSPVEHIRIGAASRLHRFVSPADGLEKNEKYILAGIVVIVLQALLIAGLLWQRSRKKSAMEDLEKLGGHLIHAQEEERPPSPENSTTTSASDWQSSTRTRQHGTNSQRWRLKSEQGSRKS